MKSQLENVLIDCLTGTLNVLVCAESTVISRSPDRTFWRYPLFNVFHAQSVESAQELVRQVQCWHAVCIDDQAGSAPEYLSVLDVWSSWIPVIVLYGDISGRSLWADELIEQSEERQQEQLVEHGQTTVTGPIIVDQVPAGRPDVIFDALEHWAIERKLLGRCPYGLVREAIKLLFMRSPLSVEDWSAAMDVSPRKFQREFKQFSTLAPKKLMALYHAYRIAFNALGEPERLGQGEMMAYAIDEKTKARVMEYVLTRRSTLLSAAY
jgi:AraC-like DNA-binding protein